MGVLIFNPAHSQETMAQFRESLRADNRHKELMKSMKQQDINSTKSRQQYIDTMHSELESTRKVIGKQTLDIIASNEAIEDAIDNGFEMVNNSLHNIGNSIESFHSDFRIGIGELIQQQRITNLLLENVSELLKIPDSEKERYNYLENGLKHYKNGLFKDSLNNLLYVEKIRTEKIGNEDNYFVLYNIGLIYLLQYDLFNAEVALKYFEQAAKYAEVETKESSAKLLRILEGKTTQDSDSGNVKKLASESYYYAAFASYLLGDFNKSIKYCQKAMTLNPKFAEAVFLGAKSQSVNSNVQLAVRNLDSLVRRLPEYSIKVSCDGDLFPKQKVKDFLLNLRDEFVKKAKAEYTNLSSKYNTINKKNDNFSTDELNHKYILPLNNELEEISNLISKNSYLDSLKAIKLFKIYQIETNINDFEKDKNDIFILHNNILNFEKEFQKYKDFSKDEVDLINEKINYTKELYNSDFIKSQKEFNNMFSTISRHIEEKKKKFIRECKASVNDEFNDMISKLRSKINNNDASIASSKQRWGCLFWIASIITAIILDNTIFVFRSASSSFFPLLFSLLFYVSAPLLLFNLILFIIRSSWESSNSSHNREIKNLRNKEEDMIKKIVEKKVVILLNSKLDFLKSLKSKYCIDCH